MDAHPTHEIEDMSSKQFGLRINEVLKARMKVRAESLGVTLAEYIKDLVKDDLKRSDQVAAFADRIFPESQELRPAEDGEA